VNNVSNRQNIALQGILDNFDKTWRKLNMNFDAENESSMKVKIPRRNNSSSLSKSSTGTTLNFFRRKPNKSYNDPNTANDLINKRNFSFAIMQNAFSKMTTDSPTASMQVDVSNRESCKGQVTKQFNSHDKMKPTFHYLFNAGKKTLFSLSSTVFAKKMHE